MIVFIAVATLCLVAALIIGITIVGIYRKYEASAVLISLQGESYYDLAEFMCLVGIAKRTPQGYYDLVRLDFRRFSIASLGQAIGSLVHMEQKNQQQIFSKLGEELNELMRSKKISNKNIEAFLMNACKRHPENEQIIRDGISSARFCNHLNSDRSALKKRIERIVRWY